MNKNIFRSGFILICFLFSFGVSTQEPANPVVFYSDLKGYHAIGHGSSQLKDEALRLAKSEAIRQIFSNIGKDVFFQEMFISTFPQFIIREEAQLTKQKDTFKAQVKVVIDQNAILMLEQQYTYALTDLLNQGETMLSETENLLAQAETAELNLRMSDALILFRSAEVQCREITQLYKNIKNTSVRSDNGNSLPVLIKINGTMNARAEEGLVRLAALEKKLEEDSALEELINTLELILNEIENIRSVIDKYNPIQPFYDLPASRLKNIRIDLDDARKKAAIVGSKLESMGEQIPAERLLIQEKIKLSINDLTRLDKILDNMNKDVTKELRYPRLVRQQHAMNWKNFVSNTGKAVKYVFMHKSSDVLSFRLKPGLIFPVEDGLQITDDFLFSIRAEKAFDVGFWIKTQYALQAASLLNEARNISSSQEMAMGYFRNTALFGAGVNWDWSRDIEEADILKEKSLKLYFGWIDRKRERAGWLCSYAYQIPQFLEPVSPAHQLNGNIEFLLRLEDLLLVEASVASHTIQNSIPDTGQIGPDNFDYEFFWRLGLGLRVPSPLVWGVDYNFSYKAPLSTLFTSESSLYSHQNKFWGFFVEYSF